MSATEGTLVAYFLFVTIGLLLYLVMFKRYKWTILLIVSYLIIFFLSSFWCIFLIIATLIVYLCGIWIGHLNKLFDIKKEGLEKEEKKKLKNKIKNEQKAIMLFGIILSFTILALLKYFHLPIGKLNDYFYIHSFKNVKHFKILFPLLGISYYTLTSTAYLIDVYRKKYDCEKNLFKLALFIGFFPLQLEGPISRYDKLSKELFKESNPTYDDLSRGGTLILWGVFKKVVIADRLALFVNEVFNHYHDYAGPILFVAGIFYAFQLYTDFSGLIDIARGVSRLFGVNLEENFQRPFLSRSVSEFWRRWHMSLGNWLRDYVFYTVAFLKPVMKLNNKVHGKVKPVFEKFIQSMIPMFFVWLVCGIWHGAGSKYIVYGMYYYVIMMMGILFEPINIKVCEKLHINSEGLFSNIVAITRTFIIIVFGLMMFRCDTLHDYFGMLSGLFKSGRYDVVNFGLVNYKDLIIMVVSILFIAGIEIVQEFIPLREKFDKSNIAIRYALLLSLVVIIILFGAYGASYGAIDPLYAAF